LICMERSPNTGGYRRFWRSGAVIVPAVFAFLCITLIVMFLSGCAPRVSYSVRTLYTDPNLSPRALSNADIAVLPLLTSRGPLSEGPLGSGVLVRKLRDLRPDLRFVSYEEFDGAFPPRFNRRGIADFYGKLFRQEVLSVKNMDSLWVHVAQPYILVYTLWDGADIKNVDESIFKHVTLICELWRRDGREVVWRASVKGVSDDGRMADGELLASSMRFLAESIPFSAPEYGRESW